MLDRLFRKKSAVPPRAAPGERVYAIGDIHGCLDLFDQIIAAIDADDATRAPAKTRIIMLGDLIDRGPDSSQVVQRAIDLAGRRPNLSILMGNHEEIILSAVRGERSSLALFNRVGGRETMLSYGVAPDRYDAVGLGELAAMIDESVPVEHLEFMASLGQSASSGDYLFVHAGIRPKVALDKQVTSDLRWIREPFLSSTAPHGAVIVHGHTVTDDIVVRDNRIGIDTGAYASGRLSALAVEGEERWFLET